MRYVFLKAHFRDTLNGETATAYFAGLEIDAQAQAQEWLADCFEQSGLEDTDDAVRVIEEMDAPRWRKRVRARQLDRLETEARRARIVGPISRAERIERAIARDMLRAGGA